jgi:hypothetical protein
VTDQLPISYRSVTDPGPGCQGQGGRGSGPGGPGPGGRGARARGARGPGPGPGSRLEITGVLPRIFEGLGDVSLGAIGENLPGTLSHQLIFL